MLIGGATVLAAVAIAGVIVAPQVFGGPSDPGCRVYSTTLGTYNEAINAINAHAGQQTLNADINAAITDLTSAASKAQSPAAKSALSDLLTELRKVRAETAAGSLSITAANKLNAASTAADNAC